MSKNTTVDLVDGVEATAHWAAVKGKSKVQALDLRSVEPHEDNMRNASGQEIFGVKLAEDTLNAAELIPSIISANGITEKPVVSKRKDGTLKMLRGHRRKAAVTLMLSDLTMALSQELRAAISKVDCEVYEGLTLEQEIDLIQDQNQQTYSRSQDMLWYWSMLKAGHTLKTLLERIYVRKANATDSKTIEKRGIIKGLTGTEREKKLFDWLKGDYQYNWAMAYRLGAITQKAALLSERLKEFPEGEKPYFFTTAYGGIKSVDSQKRMGALNTAANVDKSENKWNPEKGGPNFLAMVETFHNEDFNPDGTVKPDPDKGGKAPSTVITAAELKTRIDSAKSAIERDAFRLANGEKIPDFDVTQQTFSVLEAKRMHHNENRLKLPDDKRQQLDIFFNSGYAEFELAYNALLAK